MAAKKKAVRELQSRAFQSLVQKIRPLDPNSPTAASDLRTVLEFHRDEFPKISDPYFKLIEKNV